MATTDNALELLKQQQNELQKKLLHQEMINANLYEHLINSGIIQSNLLKTTTTSMTTSANLLELLRNRGILNHDSSNIYSNGRHETHPNSSLHGFGSILPINDVFTSLGMVFEKLFGSKFYIYAILAIFIGILFTMIACFCMYCCCCSKLGRGLMCCWKCTKFTKSVAKTSYKQKQKANENATKSALCCV
jgi:hypothetical protein